LSFLKCLSYEYEGFAFIYDRYMIKSMKLHMNIRLSLELGKVNLNKETGIYI